MHCIRLGIVGAVALMPAVAQLVSLSPLQDGNSQNASQQSAPRRFGSIRDKFDHADGTAESSNWSGYAVTGAAFTSAKASWIVPAARCSGVKGEQYAAVWVGLDGYNSASVEQTGTDSDCVGRIPNYYAWYEFYPKASVEIRGLAIKPGDYVSASVVYNSSNQEFIATITDDTTGRSYSTSTTVPGADRSSAEWIVEAPCCTTSGGILPLADFGKSYLGQDITGISGTNYATDNSNSGAIGSFPALMRVQISKIASSSSPETSTCSALPADGTSFLCRWGE